MHAQETRIYIAILTAGFILSIIIVFLFVTIVRYQRRKVAYYLEKIMADTNLMEQDRARIASDLHDDLGSSLSAIKLRLELLPETDHHYTQLVEEAKRSIDRTIQKIRQILNNIVPITLKQQGLKEAVIECLSMLSLDDQFEVQLHWNIKDEILPNDSKIHIYRIIQEVLNNTLKHAQATVVTITMRDYKNALELSITDNGKGFDRKKLKQTSKGLGLKNIMARADILKAAVYLHTEPGKGVAYQFFIPLPTLL